MRERLEMAGESSSFLLNWDKISGIEAGTKFFHLENRPFIDQAVAGFTVVAVPSSLPSSEIFCTSTR